MKTLAQDTSYRVFTSMYYAIAKPIDISIARDVYNIAWGLTYNTI